MNKLNRFDEVNLIARKIEMGIESYKGIKLPKPQLHGTIFQRKTYAQITAQKIYDKIYEYE